MNTEIDWEQLKAELQAEGYNSYKEYVISKWDELSESHKALLQSVGINP